VAKTALAAPGCPSLHAPISRKVAKSQRCFLKEKETVLGGPGGLSASGREASSVAGAASATIAQRKVSLKMVLVTLTTSEQIC